MTVRPDVVEPSSPEDDSNFRRKVRLDMRRLVGDAVGNVSTTFPRNRAIWRPGWDELLPFAYVKTSGWY